jgi:hypothetical protein
MFRTGLLTKQFSMKKCAFGVVLNFLCSGLNAEDVTMAEA